MVSLLSAGVVVATQGIATQSPALPGPHDLAQAARAGRAAGPEQSNIVTSPPAALNPPKAGSKKLTAGSTSAAATAQASPSSSGPNVATYRVYATQYKPNTDGSVEVAVPDKCVKFAALGLSTSGCPSGYVRGLDYRVIVTRDSGQSQAIPVKDAGPWNIDDNYWDPADPSFPRPRRLFGDLPRGTPESQAAFYNHYRNVANCNNLDGSPSGHSGGADQFGRCVLNPSAIDLSFAAAAQLGMPGSEWVTVSFLWEPLGSGFLAYPYGFRGGVFTAAGELTNDNRAEIATGADQGGGPQVRWFYGIGTPINSWFAYPTGFGGGVRVAIAQIGGPRIITGPGPSGGPQVRIFRPDGTASGGFFAYDPAFTGGIYVAGGNVDGSVGDEVITGAGKGGGPQVRVFRPDGTPIGGFFAYPTGFLGGVRVATGDVDGDGKKEIITGAGPGGGPQVRIFRLDGTPIGGFFAYPTGFGGGVYVSTVRSSDNKTDWIVTGAGEGGGTQVRVFKLDGTPVGGFFASDDTNGVRVAGASFNGAVPGQLAISEGPGSVPLVGLRRIDGSLFFP